MKWFYNGTFMNDGTPVTIAARNEVEEKEFISRGYRPVKTSARGSGKVRKARAPKKSKEGENG